MGARRAKSLLWPMKGEITHLALTAQLSRGRAGLLWPSAECVCCVGSHRGAIHIWPGGPRSTFSAWAEPGLAQPASPGSPRLDSEDTASILEESQHPRKSFVVYSQERAGAFWGDEEEGT